MKRPIQENIYPKWENFANQSMEKMVILFADMKKWHASAGNPENLNRYFDFGEKLAVSMIGYNFIVDIFLIMYL